MLSQKYASPLRFKILPSRILFAWVVLIHLGAMGLLLSASLPVWLIIIGSVVLLLSLSIYACRMTTGCRGLSLESVWPVFSEAVWDDSDQWQLFSQDRHAYSAQLLPSTYVTARLVVINLRLENQAWYRRQRSIVLLADNIDAETFRRLRIRLRWYSPQSPDNLAASK